MNKVNETNLIIEIKSVTEINLTLAPINIICTAMTLTNLINKTIPTNLKKSMTSINTYYM
jgi:hypothetical protein